MSTLHYTLQQLARLAKIRRQAILNMRKRGKSAAQIARDLGLSRERIRQLLARAKRD